MPLLPSGSVEPPLLLQLALDGLRLRFPRIIRTSTIIEVTDLSTVKLGLFQSLIDNVMRIAQPAGGGVAARYLRRILGQQLPEVLRAFAAGVQAREQCDEGLEGELVFSGGFFWVARDHGV